MYQDDFVILLVIVISELLYFGPGMTLIAGNSRLVCIIGSSFVQTHPNSGKFCNVYSETCQTPIMESFVKIVNG